ncbi:MAG: uroporphyrinogen decarboxylase family protein [Synergistaceae bacterium]|nr:uroporphyrinogen decarboxylase family protein [Synergistaceae bacterium]
MLFNMDSWSEEIIAAKDRRFLPILYFPCLCLKGMGVIETVHDGAKMAEIMAATVERFPTMIGAMTGMDLTADAEAFGAEVKFKDTEAPTLAGPIVSNMEEAEKLAVPDAHAARLDVFLEAVKKSQELITDRPIFGGQLGPFSLTANFLDVQKSLLLTVKEPKLLEVLLEKATDFLIERAKSYKEAGANGVLIAEPTAGLLAPKQFRRFSTIYTKKLVEAVQDSSFYVILHNCGYVSKTYDQMYETGAKGLHFGNVANMPEILAGLPADVLIFGNINPAVITTRTPEEIYAEGKKLLEATAKFPNFVFSSGCDIPAIAPLENVEAMFSVCSDFNKEHGLI